MLDELSLSTLEQMSGSSTEDYNRIETEFDTLLKGNF